jgi:hypothetical protein
MKLKDAQKIAKRTKNGDYDLNEARNDLNGLIGTKFDNRVDIKPEQKSCSHDWKYERYKG